MHKLLYAIPKLASLDMPRTVAFYERMGFTCLHQQPEYGVLRRDDVSIHFWKCDDPKIPGVTGCRVTVADVDGLYAEYQPLGIIHPNDPLADKPWNVREFSIIDSDGNLVTFGQPIER